MHGTVALDKAGIQRLYGRAVVDLREPRWSFLNTLFSVSEALLYLQLVDRLDDGRSWAAPRLDAAFEEGKSRCCAEAGAGWPQLPTAELLSDSSTLSGI